MYIKIRALPIKGFDKFFPVNEYDGNATLTTYCEKGQRVVEGWSCLRRATALLNRKNLTMDSPIVQALYKCCMAVSQAGGRSGIVVPLPENFDTGTDFQIRSDFVESWMFKDGLIEIG